MKKCIFIIFFREFLIRMASRLNRRERLDNEDITEILMDSDSEREYEDESEDDDIKTV